MRSWPKVTVCLDPSAPTPGQRLHVHVHLESRTETPYDAIEIALVGRESHYNTKTRIDKNRDVLRLRATYPAGVLSPGSSDWKTHFDLPKDIPPAYAKENITIRYDLLVRVRIPWWLDRRARYEVPVRARATSLLKAKPAVYSTQAGERRGLDPVLEVSLEGSTLPVGDQFSGAVAITGLGNRNIRCIELSVAVIKTTLGQILNETTEINSRTWVLHEGTPQDGVSVPFQVTIPEEFPITFQTPLVKVEHVLTVTAVVAFGKDILLRIPMVAKRRKTSNQVKLAEKHVLAVGNERKVDVWREGIDAIRAVSNVITEADPEHARIVLSVRGIRATITDEVSDKWGPCRVAKLEWPALGLELRLRERPWTELVLERKEDNKRFQQRFTLQTREAAQAWQFFDIELRDDLLAFDEAALDDTGATVVKKGGVYHVEALRQFFAQVESLCGHVADAIERIPPPEGFTGSIKNWKRFAKRHGAIFRVGDLFVSGFCCAGIPLQLEHRFDGHRRIESRLFAPRPQSPNESAMHDALTEATACRVVIEESRIGIIVPLVQDPEEILSVADALAATVASFRTGRTQGPYR